jgi:hypothetical protein
MDPTHDERGNGSYSDNDQGERLRYPTLDYDTSLHRIPLQQADYWPPSRFSLPSSTRSPSVMSNVTDDWIERQQPVESRYQTRRVRLTRGNVFSAEYPLVHPQL